MSRMDITKAVKTNMVSFSWHVQERMRERKINKIVLMNALMYGLVRKDAEGKTVISYQRTEVVVAANSIGLVVCTAYNR